MEFSVCSESLAKCFRRIFHNQERGIYPTTTCNVLVCVRVEKIVFTLTSNYSN